MLAKRFGLALPLAVMLLVLLAGCRTQTAAPVVAPVATVQTTAVKTQYVELNYPPSDDQGHYYALPKTGKVTVSGIVAALAPPTGVIVNGVAVKPYLVQDVAPFGTPTGYNTYGFSAPTTLTPTTLLTVALQALGVISPAVSYTPDSTATYARLVALAGLAPKVPQAQYRLGNVLLARNSYNEALAAYRRSIALQPQSAWGYDGLGQTYVLLRRPTDAVLYFKKAKKLRPKWVAPRYRLAEIYLVQKRYDDAIVEYRDALILTPRQPGLHRGYAVALYNRGRYQEAWSQVYLARQGGVKWPADFENQLRQRMPEPSKHALTPGHGQAQPGHDQKRQDGVRRSGPHAQEQPDKPGKRQDGLRQDGPHAPGQSGKHSKGN